MKAVIFDFNGTLLFDTPKHAEAWDLFARKYAGRELTFAEYRDELAGKDNRSTIEYFLGREVTMEEYRKLSHEKEDFYLQLCEEDKEFTLAPGVAAYLDLLKEKQIPFMIATSAEVRNVDFYYRRFALDRWFDRERDIICADGTMPSKPHPAIYKKAMERLGVEPAQCRVYEDLATGIASAHAAGAGEIIAVASAALPEKLEQLSGVTYAISDFTDERIREF